MRNGQKTVESTDKTNPLSFLSNLWTDERYHSIILQILALVLVFGFFAYLARNAITNLDAIGKGIGFGFLQESAGYDINQRLIEYSSRSTHLRAMVVGLLNTILVAVCGVALATVLGFTLGVLRLSGNLLASGLCRIYTEYMRNIPILIHVLMFYGILINSLPVPRNALSLGDTAFLTNRGFFLPKPIAEPIFLITIAVLVMGIIFSIWFSRYAKKVQRDTGKIYPVSLVSSVAILGVPIISFFITGAPISFETPEFSGFNFRGGLGVRPEFLALLLALSFYTAAFIGEIVRAGITSVDRGQTEAAHALGISKSKTLNLVVIPQAMRVIVPPLTSQYLNLTKNSSLAVAIGYMDIVSTTGGITLNQTGKEIECMIIVLLLYLALSLLISAVMNIYNTKVMIAER